jgi:ATP-binding cassette subfamily B protein
MQARRDRIDAMLQRELMDSVLAPNGIAHLEDAKIADLVSVGRDTFRGSWGRPGKLAQTISGLLAGHVTLLGSCMLVAAFHPLLGAAMLAVCLWAAHEDKVASRTEAAHHYGSTETARRMEYYYELGTTPPAAKEVRVFGLSSFLVQRFSSTWRRTMDAVLAPIARRHGSVILVETGTSAAAWSTNDMTVLHTRCAGRACLEAAARRLRPTPASP